MLLSTVHESTSQDLCLSFGRAKGRCPSNEFEGVQYALWQGEGSCRKNEISCFVPPTFGSAVASSSSSSFTFVPPFSRYLLSIYSFHCINSICMFGVSRCTAFGLGQRARARDPQSLWEDLGGSRPISSRFCSHALALLSKPCIPVNLIQQLLICICLHKTCKTFHTTGSRFAKVII